MAVENDFLVFAGQSGANVVPQSSYAGQTWQQTGFIAGVAPSAQLNKPWRQSSIMAAVLAQFVVNNSGQPAIDDGTTATLLANLQAAVSAASRTQVILTDTGAANAYAAANPSPFAALPTTSGVTQKVFIAHTNTASSTYAPDGLAAKPIYGLGGNLLQGGELPANGLATLVSFVSPLLNSGNLCWVLYECVGGAQQVAAGTQSNQAINLGQLAAQLSASGYLEIPCVVGGVARVAIVQWVSVLTSTGGYTAATFPIQFPNACLAISVSAADGNSGTPTLKSFPNYATPSLSSVPVYVTQLSGNLAAVSCTVIAVGW